MFLPIFPSLSLSLSLSSHVCVLTCMHTPIANGYLHLSLSIYLEDEDKLQKKNYIDAIQYKNTEDYFVLFYKNT